METQEQYLKWNKKNQKMKKKKFEDEEKKLLK